jgi:hypothetical protein
MPTLGDVIEAYEYNYEDNASKNIARLFDIAGAFEPEYANCIFEELEINSEATNLAEILIKLKDQADPQTRAEIISTELTFQDFTSAHNLLVKLSQQLFFNRSGERWDSSIPSWISSNANKIMDTLQLIGTCQVIKPRNEEYDCIAVFGATANEMSKRVDFAYKLHSDVTIHKGIFLLTGERYAIPKVDTDKAITQAAEYFNIPSSNVTEAHIMEKIYLEQGEKFSPCMNYKVVNVPKGEKSRPNTEDTIHRFLDEYETVCTSTLFISRSPNTYAQAEATHLVLYNRNSAMEYEVVGGSCNYDEVPPVYAAYHTLMPMAGAWLGGYSRVEREVTGMEIEAKYSLKFNEQCVVRSSEKLQKGF